MKMESKNYVICKNQFLDPRSKKALNLARRAGYEIDAKRKLDAGTNRQNVSTKWSPSDENNLGDTKKFEQVPRDVRQLIQNGRLEKGWTQKDLAQKISEKQNLIKNFEAGNTILNDKILMKIERVLGIKLRGKDRGQYIFPQVKVENTRM